MKNDSLSDLNDGWDMIRTMSENNTGSHSLCSSCKNGAGCSFQKDRPKPVVYCEEFEIEAGPFAKISEKIKPLSPPSAEGNDKKTGPYNGLCTNCDNRKTCGFPKPESGIWHCEEYK